MEVLYCFLLMFIQIQILWEFQWVLLDTVLSILFLRRDDDQGLFVIILSRIIYEAAYSKTQHCVSSRFPAPSETCTSHWIAQAENGSPWYCLYVLRTYLEVSLMRSSHPCQGLYDAAAVCVCCSICSISRIICLVKNSCHIFWWCFAGWCFVQ